MAFSLDFSDYFCGQLCTDAKVTIPTVIIKQQEGYYGFFSFVKK